MGLFKKLRFKKIRSFTDRLLPNVPIIGNAYNIANEIGKATGLTKNINRIVSPRLSIGNPIPSRSNTQSGVTFNSIIESIKGLASTPQQASNNASAIASLEAEIKQLKIPFWEKIKAWFLIRWYTAKGVVIGLVIGVLLVLGLLFGWIPIPKRKGW